jgi:hypothetical protein
VRPRWIARLRVTQESEQKIAIERRRDEALLAQLLEKRQRIATNLRGERVQRKKLETEAHQKRKQVEGLIKWAERNEIGIVNVDGRIKTLAADLAEIDKVLNTAGHEQQR